MNALPDAIHQQLVSLGVRERRAFRKYVRAGNKPSRFDWFFKCYNVKQQIIGIIIFGKVRDTEVNTEQMTPLDSDLVSQMCNIGQHDFARIYLQDRNGDCYYINAFGQHQRSSDPDRLMCRTYDVNQTAMRNDQGLW